MISLNIFGCRLTNPTNDIHKTFLLAPSVLFLAGCFPAVKRQPDGGVTHAVAQIRKNDKFKRLMMFGLRSLSGLCVPPTIKYKENAIAALEEGVATCIAEAIKSDPRDEDCGVLGCRSEPSARGSASKYSNGGALSY